MEKCTKYEALFIFATEQEFEEHLKNCHDCQKQHEEMQKISNLVKELKPYFKKKTFISGFKTQVATIFLVAFAAFFALNHFNQNQEVDYLAMEENSSITIIDDTYSYYIVLDETSSLTEMGFSTDEYGLLLIE